MMERFVGVFSRRNVNKENEKKEENIMFKNKSAEQVVGVVDTKKKQEGENKMKNIIGNMFGRKASEVNKNKEETKMLDKIALIAAHGQAISHGVKLVSRAIKEEVKSGYYQGVEEYNAEDTSEAVVEKETTVETSKPESSFQEFAATLGTVVNAPVEEASEELVQAHVELTKEFAPEVVQEITKSIEDLEGVTEEEVSEQVDTYLASLSKVSLETGAPSCFMKAGRLTGFLVGKVKGIFSGTGEKIEEVMEDSKTYFKDTRLFDIFKDATKMIAKATASLTLSAWLINQVGLTALAGWVATPAALLIVFYPFIILAVMNAKLVVNSGQ